MDMTTIGYPTKVLTCVHLPNGKFHHVSGVHPLRGGSTVIAYVPLGLKEVQHQNYSSTPPCLDE